MPVPQHDDGHHHGRLILLALVALVAGCTSPPAPEEALEAASVEGGIRIGDAFVVHAARISVAPRNDGAEGTPGQPVELAEPPWIARTALQRDHWVLEVELRERAAGTGLGEHRVRLDWNGALLGSVHVGGPNATRPLGVVLRFDVGERLERSNVYALEITRVA